MNESLGNYVSDRIFNWILPLFMAGFIAIGLSMGTVKPALEDMRSVQSRHRMSVSITPERKAAKSVVAKKQLPTAKKIVESEPVDLAKKPQVAQEQDNIQDAPKDAKPVRKVYGLRKVYSKGLGAAGSMSDAVVGKIGNTLNKDFDTIVATNEEIKGAVVSTTTVTSPPRFKRMVKPEYTKDMLDNKIEGVVKVKALVDIDGRVKKVSVLNDIGFESGSQALKATLSMEFVPALRGDDPVAVWIVIPIRFVMIG